MKYVIISPVRNEEKFVGKTIESVAAQTKKPEEWIMVNDGSVDSTAEIINKYQKKYKWIKLIELKDRGYYYPGTGIVNVFYKGYDQIKTKDWDFVVKLDCDLEFDPDYFENLFSEFERNPRLGIASGCMYNLHNGELIRETAQEDHPFGASKVYRRECWEDTGGILPIPGWDLADLLAAQMHNWSTACFFHLKVIHYRPGGSRRKGVWAPKFLQGRFEYRHGYSFGYTFMKAGYHVFSKPMFIGSLAKVSGYLYAKMKKEPYLFKEDMRLYLRNKHKSFLRNKIRANSR